MRHCESPWFYRRRRTREVVVGDPRRGGVVIGGDHPVVLQSMLTCDTMATAECVRQTLDLVAAGCQLVRITAPTVKDAANLRNIVEELRRRGCPVPILEVTNILALLGGTANPSMQPAIFPRFVYFVIVSKIMRMFNRIAHKTGAKS